MDEIYLNSIKVSVARFTIGTASDGSILISAGTGKGNRLAGLTSLECRQLLLALDEYVHMRDVEEYGGGN